MVLELVLYGRPVCHLCHEMVDELDEALRGRPYRLRVENVDQNPDWQARYGSRIPVLTTVDGRELCHYRLEPAILNRLISP